MEAALLYQIGPFHHQDGMWMGWHWAWWLFWLVVLGVVVWGLTRVARGAASPTRGRKGLAEAEQVLRERFARGEISREEYEERLVVLRGSE